MNKIIQIEIIVNMMKYFSQNTKYCHLLKMMKLIYLSDLYSLRENGDIISGLKFKKWEKGPVAQDIYEMLKGRILWKDYGVKINESRFNQDIDESPDLGFEFIYKNTNFNKKWFSENEIKILEKVANIYRDVKSKQISKITHIGRSKEGFPWCNAKMDDYINFEDYLGDEKTEEQIRNFEDIFKYNQKLREYDRSKT